jgi:hypothetical protein
MSGNAKLGEVEGFDAAAVALDVGTEVSPIDGGM